MRVSLRITILALCAATSAHGLAQPAADDARRIGRGALDRFASGDFQTAFEEFARAERYAHSPVFGLYMARCQAKLGSLQRARRLYEQVAAETLAPGAPEPWRKAQDDARAEVGALLSRIPSIVIVGVLRDMRVRIDGSSLREQDLATAIDLDPGAHVVEVANAFGVTTRTIELREGVRGRLIDVREFATRANPKLTAIAPVRARRPVRSLVPRAPAEARTRAGSARFVVPLAMGGALVAAGTVFGVVAAAKLADVRSRCDGRRCFPSEQDDVDAARRWAALSTAAFTAGGAGLAVGATLYFTRPNSTSDTPFVGVQLQGSR